MNPVFSPNDSCIVVEDAVSGIRASNQGGFFSVGISDAAEKAICSLKIHQLSDILFLF